MVVYLLMNGVITKNKTAITPLGVSKIRRLFSVGSEITELAEEVLEELGEYKQEFLLGLEKSVKEAKSGKLKKIKSLKDLG
ncbi:MAG: hypothetical protein HYT38_01815 [Candidatus Sungbacteria bacterium]|uniref:Uncharacterized protein n=1 Tax=Candidatus Sungiibacteriota bacterium TaxID=2750080 RepID=A0A932DSR4_9BACT|nr:hypothetical protein [Candidatus Sungbacteria bacterium]MBI2466154.1 hypothetical protein [Candidatus Sungbacteria bacterium]